MRTIPAFFLAATFICPFMTGCEMYTQKGPFPAYSKKTLIPSTFLYSKYKPLNEWLDTPVRVVISEVPLNEVYNHPALRGVNFELVRSRPDNPLVTIDSLALTRRQLLWTLAYDYELTMNAEFSPEGGPSHIAVRSRLIKQP